MALPSSGSITLGMVAAELGIGLPLSLGDSRVRTLAGVPSGPISLGQLRGKSAVATLSASGNNSYGYGSSNNAGIVSAYPSVNVSGGTGAKSFTWSVLSASSPADISGANTQYPTVSKSFAKLSQGFTTVYLRCVISDSSGSVTVDNIVAELEWSSTV